MMRQLSELIWPRETERLTLRLARVEDGGAVYAYRSLPEVALYLSRVQDPDRWAVEWPLRVPTTIAVEVAGGQLIGDVRIAEGKTHAQDEVEARARGSQAELMWAFHPDWHGQGYVTEALSALIEIAFGQLRVRRVTAACYADNEPSWRLMERVGMRREGQELRSALHRDGTWRDFLVYGLLAPGA
jgi:RimJ/RimL family protein N-acetyltransferase